MSSEHVSYVGPYVVAKSHEQKGIESVETCVNTSCKQYGLPLRDPYCRVCGSQVELTDVEIDEFSVNAWDMMEEIDQKMCSHTTEKGMDCWFSNLTTMGKKVGRSLSVGEEDMEFLITPKVIGKEIKAFMELHGKDIEKLKDAYDSVEIRWGILAYWR